LVTQAVAELVVEDGIPEIPTAAEDIMVGWPVDDGWMMDDGFCSHLPEVACDCFVAEKGLSL